MFDVTRLIIDSTLEISECLLTFSGRRVAGQPLGYDMQRERLIIPVRQPDLHTGDPGGPCVQRHHRPSLRGDHQRHPLQKPGGQQATQ